MFNAWVDKIATALKSYIDIDDTTTLAGFGGAGALAATRIADATGVNRVIIPGLGAVFSAVGIGFSPLSQVYQFTLDEHSDEALHRVARSTRARAEKDMFAEGVDLHDCIIDMSLLHIHNGEEQIFPISEASALPCDVHDDDRLILLYEARKKISQLRFQPVGNEPSQEAKVERTRRVMVEAGNYKEVPVIRLEDQSPGATAIGPAIIEEAFFTGLIDPGWRLKVSGNNDLILEKSV